MGMDIWFRCTVLYMLSTYCGQFYTSGICDCVFHSTQKSLLSPHTVECTDLNLITLLMLRIFLHSMKCKLVVYLLGFKSL
jgi:hypothetical protein